MKKFLALAALFTASFALAQPANDNCSGAQALGSLPTPAACPSGAGSNITVPGTLVGATAANPYTYQGTGCTGSSTTMAAPANDVWYTFVATGYQLNLSLSGTIANPNVAVYSGTCGSLGGGVGGCAVGTAGGSATLTVYQMVIGQTYYIQVSGNSSTASGTFTLTLNNSKDCNNCLGASNLTVTPPPTNGMYAPGTTVNFCFKVNSYSQVNTNWLHGVQLAFGSGWNLGSLTTSPPPSCQGTGYWAYYPGGIIDNSGQTWPSGFYFETTTGQNNPGNNFGDNCSGNISGSNWNFCFSIQTASTCNPGSNLSVVVNTSGDGESGSWSSLGCSGDPATSFNAIGACCPPTMTATPVSCNGGTDGTTTATPVGTQSPFTYTWSPTGGNSATATNLPAGTYTVSVIDKNNCLATNTVTVTQPTAVTLTLTPANAACGVNNGSVTATAGGGTPAYTYQINNGGYAASSSFTALGAGTYTVDVKDSKGCVKTATVAITAPATPTVTVNSPSSCNGNAVTLSASGATSYSWSPGTGLSATTGSAVTANPGTTTVYTVTGTTSSCTAAATSTVTVIANPTVTVNSATICAGQQTATLTANGAATYSWSPGTGLSATSGATVSANPGATTVYTITGSAGSCTSVATSTVTVNAVPTITVNTGTICVGQQTATLTAGGASTYTWSPATGLSSANGNPVTANPPATTNYTVSGTNASGCVNSASTTVVVNPLPLVNTSGGLICNGASMILTVSGASTYSWTPGTGLSATTGSAVTANPASTTQYTVVGIDGNGCINGDTATVTVVNNPTVTVTSGTICVGQQTTTLTASGASTYSWSPASGLSATTGSSVAANPGSTSTYTVTGTVGTCTASATSTVSVLPLPVISANSGTICVGQQTTTLTASGGSTYSWSPATGLSSSSGSSVTANPGNTTTYTISGTDGNGCVNTGTTSVLVNQLPNVTASSASVCAGASATLNANGGSTYTWTPATGLSSSNGASVSASPASTSSYTVTGTDANGCYNSAVATVTVVANPVISVTTGTVCSGQGTTTLTASGASTYTWSPATGLSSASGSSVTANPSTTSVYTVTGTAQSCTASATTTVTVSSLPNITAASNSPVCVNQTLNLTAGGGIGYAWAGPNSFTSISAAPSISGVTMAAMGAYTVTGVDAGGCTNTATVSVIVNPLPVVTATGATVCLGQNFSLASTPSNAQAYSWTGPGGFVSNQQNPVFTNAATGMAGTYVVTVTDPNGCANANVAQVLVNSLPVVTVNSGTICAGQSTATLSAQGANSYSWSPATGLNNAQSAIVSANPSSTTVYTVTGADMNGCQNVATATVNVNPVPPVAVAPQNFSGCAPVCVTFSNTTSASGTCGWSFGDGASGNLCTQSHCYPVAGNYNVTLTLTDGNGCVGTAGATVNVFPVPFADFNANPQPANILEPSVQFYNTSGGAVITSYNWTFGDYGNNSTSAEMNPVHVYGDTGTFTAQLVVTSNYGCKDSIVRYIRVDDEFALYVPNAFSPNTDGVNDFFKAYGTGIDNTTFNLWVYDRWGNEVWYAWDINDGWDGRFRGKSDDIVQEDVYVWLIKVRTLKGQKKKLSGTVTLIK
jgi:gliding motility-associated-like protein